MAINGNREFYKGIGMKQKGGIIGVFNNFFSGEKFDTIIELGTGSGAFATYMAEKAAEMSAFFITFDINNTGPGIEDYLNSLGAVFSKEDLDASTKIEGLISNGNRTLILNDALKETHLRRLAPVLKLGDCIMSHDWGIEYMLEDISECLQKNGLEVRYSELFKPEFLWLCCIKEK